MPRVYLTAEQREQAAIDKIRLALSDGIAVQKSRNRPPTSSIRKT